MSAPNLISPTTLSGGTPVGGSGTTNTIPRWTGPSTLGDSGITDNGSTVSFVGRNITAPSTAGGASYVLAPTSGQVFGQTVGSSVWYLGRTTAAGAAVQSDICVNASGNVGIGTASPTSTTDIWGLQANTGATSASVPTGTMRVAYAGAAAAGNFGSSVVFTQRWASANAQQVAVGQITGVKIAGDGFYGGGLAFFTSNGSGNDLAERARIDSAGRALWNKTGTPAGSGIAHVVGPRSGATSGGTEWIGSAGNGFALIQRSSGGADVYSFTGDVGAEAYTQIGLWDASSLNISLVSGYGLKLPATPGNADTQTLDAYREDTFTTSFSGLGNCSNVSASNLRFTQIGRLVTIEGTFTFTVTAATTQTNFNFTLPSGRNRGSTANAGCGIGVDNASTFTGAIWNASGDATTAAIYFGPTNPFGAGTVRTVPFSYSYYTAT